MNSSTQIRLVAGPVGAIDVAIDLPPAGATGIAVIAHPHPLFGGSRDNKVVQTLARALLQHGHACWRPNFRGVGASEGSHDEGQGETEDLLAVVRAAREHPSASPQLPLLLAGFSFGGFVQCQVADALARQGSSPRGMVLVAPAVSRFRVAPVSVRTLVIHGEVDDLVPLPAVLDWARPQELPIVVVPGADHFFHGRLPLLKRIVGEWIRGAPVETDATDG